MEYICNLRASKNFRNKIFINKKACLGPCNREGIKKSYSTSLHKVLRGKPCSQDQSPQLPLSWLSIVEKCHKEGASERPP